MSRETMWRRACWLIGVLMFIAPSEGVLACTDARVIAANGTVIAARSMEFGAEMHSRLVVRPRSSQLTSPAPNGARGFSWTGKYGYVYLDAFGIDAVVDGMNEAGLGFGALYLPSFAGYETIAPTDNASAMSNLTLGAWVLSRFANVDEVRAALPTIHVWGEPLAMFGNSFVPLHFVVHDAQGKSIVLEWVGGKLAIYDNTVGVMTNSPTYDWQTVNLRNYVNLSPNNVKPAVVGGISYASTGQGSGLVGLPGDPTPPSRFVETAIALAAATRPSDATGALVLAQKLMNRVDLPAGLARDTGAGDSDTTQWVVFRDLTDRIYYYRTYNDMTLRAVDLKKLDLSPGVSPRRIVIGTTRPTVIMLESADIPPIR